MGEQGFGEIEARAGIEPGGVAQDVKEGLFMGLPGSQGCGLTSYCHTVVSYLHAKYEK